MKAHKFITGDVGGPNYRGVIFCQNCGQVAFYANDSGVSAAQREEDSKKPCPLGPEAMDMDRIVAILDSAWGGINAAMSILEDHVASNDGRMVEMVSAVSRFQDLMGPFVEK